MERGRGEGKGRWREGRQGLVKRRKGYEVGEGGRSAREGRREGVREERNVVGWGRKMSEGTRGMSESCS